MSSTLFFNCYIDCEWDSQGKALSLQASISGRDTTYATYLILNEDYRHLLEPRGVLPGFNPRYSAHVYYKSFIDSEDLITWLIYEHCSKYNHSTSNQQISCALFLFYSPKDLWIALGFENFRELVSRGKKRGTNFINQKRALFGSFVRKLEDRFLVKYKVKDVSGWTNQGLASFASGLGIELQDKGALDEYKSCMEVALVEKPETFISYALNDMMFNFYTMFCGN